MYKIAIDIPNPINHPKCVTKATLTTNINELNVNYFLTTSIASGLKEALKAKGIFGYVYKEFREDILFGLN